MGELFVRDESVKICKKIFYIDWEAGREDLYIIEILCNVYIYIYYLIYMGYRLNLKPRLWLSYLQNNRKKSIKLMIHKRGGSLVISL